ncbi:PE family protein [Mycobacterium sp.]|uniref:PE family protein n=1 Tax=Mycobacterium sp. TaxID=1785 RepID=UPI003A86332C
MSSYVIAAPAAVAAASGDLAAIGEAIRGAAAAAAPSTTGVVAAAADEVSTAIAKLFDGFAREFQMLSVKATAFQTRFEHTLSAAGAAYADAEADNISQLRSLLRPAASSSPFSPGGIGEAPFGGTATATLGALLNSATNAAGLGEILNFPSSVALSAPTTNGVVGARIGFSFLQIPIGPNSFLGMTIPQFSYPAPALWYFPTQADGSVNANGTLYLQHGLGASGWLQQPLAIELAQQTNSVVVTPTVPSLRLPLGLWLRSPQMQQGVASLFQGPQTALNIGAQQAGFHGTLPPDFILAGHSGGGGLASIAAGDYLATLGTAPNHLKGVVMFDGVARDTAAFSTAVANLQAANVPIYTVAAPPMAGNIFGSTTNQLVDLYPNQFVGAEIVGGSHLDAMLGGRPIADLALQLITQFSPPGATSAVYALSTGWINDIWAGYGPTNPMYGSYGPTGGYLPPGGQTIFVGPTTAIILPV